MGLQMHLAPGRDLNAVALEIKDIYLGGNNVTKDNLIEITNIMSDFNFIWASKQAAILHGRRNAQVFPYMFTYRGNFSLSDTTGYPPQGSMPLPSPNGYLIIINDGFTFLNQINRSFTCR